MPTKPQLNDTQYEKVRAWLEPITHREFLKAFQKVTDYVKGVETRLLASVAQLNAKIDKRLAAIKDGKAGPEGPQGKPGPKGDKGDMGLPGDPPTRAALIELMRTLQPELEPINAEAVRNLLESLVGANRLEMSAINGLEEYLFGLKKQFENAKVIHVGAPQVTTSSSGATITTETPGGVVDGVNAIFTPSKQPLWVVSDSATYYEGKGYTWDGSNITMDVAPSLFIRDIISS